MLDRPCKLVAAMKVMLCWRLLANAPKICQARGYDETQLASERLGQRGGTILTLCRLLSEADQPTERRY